MATSIKILYHSRTFATGGARVHIDQIVNNLIKCGCEVKIVEPVSGGRKSHKAILLSDIKSKLPSFVAEILELLYGFKAYRELNKYNDIKLLYERHALFNLAGMWYAKKNKIPFFLEVNSPLAYEREKYGSLCFKKIAYMLERHVFEAADKIFCVSEKLKSILVRYGLDPTNIIVNHNGVDKDYSIPTKDYNLVKKYDLEYKVVIGFVGYMLPWHGGDVLIKTLIKLFAEFENIVFLLVGGIDCGVDLSIMNMYRDRFIIIKNVDHDNIYNFINLFDVGVMAQSNDYGSPMKLIEYMGLGKAVIGPDTPAVREIIKNHETGILVNPGDSEDLYLKLSMLIINENERIYLGENARSFIINNKMTWQDNARRIIDQYQLYK